MSQKRSKKASLALAMAVFVGAGMLKTPVYAKTETVVTGSDPTQVVTPSNSTRVNHSELAVGDEIHINGLVYEITRMPTSNANGRLTLIDGQAASGAVVIVDGMEYQGAEYNITALDANAFAGNTNLTSIDMRQSSVSSIGRNCFNGCTSLSSVHFSESSITNMLYGGVFAGCTSLTQLYVPSIHLSSKYSNSPFSRSSIQELTIDQLSSTGIKSNLLNNMPDGFTLNLPGDISSNALVATTFGTTKNVTLNLGTQEDVDHYTSVFEGKDVNVQLYGSGEDTTMAIVSDPDGAEHGYASLQEALNAINTSSTSGAYAIRIMDSGSTTVEWPAGVTLNKMATIDFNGASVHFPETLTLQAPLTIKNITNINSGTNVLTTLNAGSHAFTMINGGSFGFAKISGSNLTFSGTLPGGQFGGGTQVALEGIGDASIITLSDIGRSDYYYDLPNMTGFNTLVLNRAFLEADGSTTFHDQLEGVDTIQLQDGGLTLNQNATIPSVSGNGELRLHQNAQLQVTDSFSGNFSLPEYTGTELVGSGLTLPSGASGTLTNQNQQPITISEPIVSVSGLGNYASLDSALAAIAQDDATAYTITLLSDVLLNADITLPDKDITMDGQNQYQLTMSTNHTMTVQNSLTLENINLAMDNATISYMRSQNGNKTITLSGTTSGKVGTIQDISGSRWLDIVIEGNVDFDKIIGTTSSIGTQLTDLILVNQGSKESPLDLSSKVENLAATELNHSWVIVSGDATYLGTIRTDYNKESGTNRTGGLVIEGSATVSRLSVNSNDDFEVWMPSDALLTVEERYSYYREQVPIYVEGEVVEGHVLVKAPSNSNRNMTDYVLANAGENVELYWNEDASVYQVNYAPTISMSSEANQYNGAYTEVALMIVDTQGIASVVVNGQQETSFESGKLYTPASEWLIQGENTVMVTDTLGMTTTFTFRYDAPANYQKVEEVLASIPADLTIYTEASVQALEEAIAQIQYGIGSSDQTQVDEMAQAVQLAIDGLELKGTDEPTDPGTTPEDPGTTPEDPDTTPDQPIITPSEPTISQETPVTPSNPSSSQNAATPQTGDAAPLSMWATFTILASSMFGVVSAKRRKQD